MRQLLQTCAWTGIVLALWLGVTMLSTTGDPLSITREPIRFARPSAPPIMLPMDRVSTGGVHYGRCVGAVLAVALFPEPCGWVGRDRDVATR